MDELIRYIHAQARTAGVTLDKYDPDFIIGVIMEFLNQRNHILTPSGLKSKEELDFMEDQLQFYQANYAGDPD